MIYIVDMNLYILVKVMMLMCLW